MDAWLSAAEQAEIWDRYEAGQYMRPIARAIGRSSGAVRDLIAKTGGVRPLAPTEWSDARLSLVEREEISRGIAGGESLRHIARRWAGHPRRSRGGGGQRWATSPIGPVTPTPSLAWGPAARRLPSWPPVRGSGGWWRPS